MTRIRSSLSYANVMATLAFFLALTGSAVYAADKLGSKDIGKNAIKTKHVKDDALTGNDIDESALGKVAAAATADKAVSADRATRATTAASAEQATKAEQATTADQASWAADAFKAESAAEAEFASEASFADHAGEAGVSGYERIYGGNVTIGAGKVPILNVQCPPDKVAISGGHWTDNLAVRELWAYATDNRTYSVALWNTDTSSRQAGVHVVCVKG